MYAIFFYLVLILTTNGKTNISQKWTKKNNSSWSPQDHVTSTVNMGIYPSLQLLQMNIVIK